MGAARCQILSGALERLAGSMVGQAIDRGLAAVDRIEGPVGLLVREANVDDFALVGDVDEGHDKVNGDWFPARLEPLGDLWSEPLEDAADDCLLLRGKAATRSVGDRSEESPYLDEVVLRRVPGRGIGKPCGDLGTVRLARCALPARLDRQESGDAGGDGHRVGSRADRDVARRPEATADRLHRLVTELSVQL